MDLPASVSRRTAGHCAALVHADSCEIEGHAALAPLRAQGSITFVDLDGECLGITNEHVVRGMLDVDTPSTLYIALSVLYAIPPGSLIALSTPENCDTPFDIAVLRLDRAAIIAGGKAPVRASERRLREGDVGMAVGFPGSLRQPLSGVIMAHPLTHVAATCCGSSDRSLVLQDSLGIGTPPTLFGGMSGGPIFWVESVEKVDLVGITYEGRGFREADVSTIAQDDVWILGFPLTGSSLRRIIESAAYQD